MAEKVKMGPCPKAGAATATINVPAINAGTPVAANDSFTLPTGTTYFISAASLLGNDTLYDDAKITANTDPAAGTLAGLLAVIVLSDGADTKSAKSADRALKEALAVNAMILRVALAPLDALERTAARVQGGDMDARAPLSPLADREMLRDRADRMGRQKG